jgi:hypothetical protein
MSSEHWPQGFVDDLNAVAASYVGTQGTPHHVEQSVWAVIRTHQAAGAIGLDVFTRLTPRGALQIIGPNDGCAWPAITLTFQMSSGGAAARRLAELIARRTPADG